MGALHQAVIGSLGGTPAPSGPPTVETTASGVMGSLGTSSHPITMPSGIQAGDLLVSFLATDGGVTVSVDTGASGEDWTIEAQIAEGTALAGAVVWKVASGSGDALTLTTSAAEQTAHVCYRISGGATSVDAGAASGAFNTGQPNPPSLTPSVSAELWLAFGGTDNITTATAAPTDFTGLVAVPHSAAAGASAMAAHRVTTASSLDPGVFTNGSTEEWVAFTVAIL